MIVLSTVDAVISALEGEVALAALTGRLNTAVYNWRSRGKFPPDTYLQMTRELNNRGKSAPSTLWGIPESVNPEVPMRQEGGKWSATKALTSKQRA